MSTSQQKTLGDFIELKNRNAISHVVRTAVNLGIVTALTSGQKTVEQLADQLNLQTEPLRRLMNVLANSELVEKYGDDFALSPIGKLIPANFMDFGDHFWEHLTKHVREGVRLPDDPNVPHEERDYLIDKTSEEWTLTPVALDAAEALDIGKSRRGLRILEIACGSGIFASTMAHRDPDSVINLLDDVEGLQMAQKTVDSIGLERQVQLITSKHPLELESIPELQDQFFDLVLLVGIIHRLNREQSQNLFSEIFKLVKPERELAIIDVFPGQEPGDVQRSIFELELGLRTSSGQLHDPVELKATLKEVGFGNLQYAHLPSPPHIWGLMLAQKP